MAPVRILGYAIIGFFICFVLTFAIDNFAGARTDSILAPDGYSRIYQGPAWAVFWESLPIAISTFILPIVGAVCGALLGIVFPRSLKG